MGLADSITSLVTDTVTITRHAAGTFTNGIYAPGAASTFTADVVMQPAFGLNRVVGGADMRGSVENEATTEVLDFFTLTEIRTRKRNPPTDPDIVTYDGSDWTVARVERWPDLDGGHYFRVVITRETQGAS